MKKFIVSYNNSSLRLFSEKLTVNNENNKNKTENNVNWTSNIEVNIYFERK